MVGFQVLEPNIQEYHGQLYIDLGKNRSSIEFMAEKGNSANVEYTFNVKLLLFSWEPLMVRGKFAMLEGKANAEMVWKYGETNYSAILEYLQSSTQLLKGTIKINDDEYLGKFSFNETEKGNLINFEIIGTRHIQLMAFISNGIVLDIYWDKVNEPSKRILLNATTGPQSISAEFNVNDVEGKFSVSFTSSSLDITLQWGAHCLKAEGKFEISFQNFEILAVLNTTCQGLKEMRVHIKLRYDRGLQGVKVDSRVSNILLHIFSVV